jgi:hemolysin activation/secretion protein
MSKKTCLSRRSKRTLYSIALLQAMTYGGTLALSQVADQYPAQKERELEKRNAVALKELASVKPDEPKPAEKPAVADPANQARVMVRRVVFSGQSIFSDKELEAVVAKDLGREMTLGELRQMAAKVTKHYQEHGYFLAYVVIPEQNLNETPGTVKFLVLEGRLGNIAVRGNKRYSEKRVRGQMSDLKAGKPIKKDDLERSILQLNRTSGIKSCSSVLQAGKEVGFTDVNVDIAEENRITGSLEFNNFGTDTTGQYRVAPSLRLPNVTGRGDGLGVDLIGSPDIGEMYYGQANYMTPLGDSGTRLNTYAAAGNYEVGQEFAALGIKGKMQSWGVGVSHPLLLTPRTSVNFETWFESKDFEQTMSGTTTSKDEVRKLRLGVNVDRQDQWGRTFFSAGVHFGLGEFLGGMENNSVLASRYLADNQFTKLAFEFTRLQRLTDRIFLIGRVAGQYSFDSLVSGEQWSIGGADSVRGHQQSAYLGDSGFTASLEARYSLLPNNNRYQLAGFIDHGQTYIKTPAIGQEDSQNISGAGVGIRATPIDNLPIRLDVGVPIGEKTGDSVYLYFQASYNF